MVTVTAWTATPYGDMLAVLSDSSFGAEGWTDSRQAHIISHRHVKPVRL
jgi:hypothetical protein